MKAQYQNAATTETLLYGVKIGEPDYMADVLYECKGYVNNDELMAKGKVWADANGYDRLRVSVIDLSTPPNFAKTVNV
jgi:hypothetical protein